MVAGKRLKTRTVKSIIRQKEKKYDLNVIVSRFFLKTFEILPPRLCRH